MSVAKTIEVAAGWLELGLGDEALLELEALPSNAKSARQVMEIKLAAQMAVRQWNSASETARMLCLEAKNEPDYFLQAAFCLHETGDTFAARNWLLKGPKALFEMAIFHYNLACYLWTLDESERARRHLKKAISMDQNLVSSALDDRDLVGIDPLN